MNRQRLTVLYSGHVQGVGFRFAVRQVATGFEVVGTVRNLPDGRVELVAEGQRPELEALREAIREAGLGALIRQETAAWGGATGGFRGFEIVR
jgi:acylphosphatase